MTYETCCVSVGATQLLLEMHCLHKVLPPTPITPLPLTANFISGLINVRNEVIVVIHLGELLKLNATKNQQILIVQHEHEKMGILIDEVISFKSFSGPLATPHPNELSAIIEKHTKGVLGEERLPLVDIQSITLNQSE